MWPETTTSRLANAFKSFKSKVLDLHVKDIEILKENFENAAGEDDQEKEQGIDITPSKHGMEFSRAY